MDLARRKLLQFAAAAAVVASLPASLLAQTPNPNQSVRVVIPFTAGSTTDIIGRAVTDRLRIAFGQAFVIDNRPGAGGALGAALVAAAPADGRTILVHSAGHTANATLYPTLKYDTAKDFTPVTMLASMPNVIVVAPDKGYTSLNDLIQRAKAAPGKFSYGSAGNGSGSHIAGEKFRVAAGLEVAHVPYRGAPEVMNDVMGGRIDWFLAPAAPAVPLVKSGKLSALAVAAPGRSPLLPDVPTTAEAGVSGGDQLFWVGMFVSSKTPAAIVEQLHAETVRILKSEEVRSRLATLAADPAPMPQAEFAKLVRDEIVSTAALIKRAGIRVD